MSSIRQLISDRPWILALLVTLGVLAWMLSGTLGRIGSEPATVAAAGNVSADAALTRVKVRTQIAQPVTRFVSVYGRSAPARAVELNAETDGRVVRISAARGQQLEKGNVILWLDLRDRKARLEQATASVNEHETAYRGQLKLREEGYVSDTQIAETLAKLEAAKAERLRARIDLDNRIIRAPFDGVLQEREVEIGNFVRAGDLVASFVDNTRLVVTGTIAEQDARFVAIGDVAEATLVTGEAVQGRIRYVDPVADLATRTFTVELEVDNPQGSLPVGVTAQMRIPADELFAQKISPALLTLDDDGTVGVKTIDDYNRVVFNPIGIARSEVDGVWVTGLPETANVIVLGQGYVAAGQEVDPAFAEEETALAAESRQ